MRKIIIFITSVMCIVIFVPMFGFGWISTILGQILQFINLVINTCGGVLGFLWGKIIFFIGTIGQSITAFFNWVLNYFILRYVDAGFFPPVLSTIAFTILGWFNYTKRLIRKGNALLKYLFRLSKSKLAQGAQKFLKRGEKLKQIARDKLKSLL